MTATTDPRYSDRILADSETDRAGWEVARDSLFGASDAAKFAKPSSSDLYLRDKLTPSAFRGNRYTESGNRWEPLMLNWAGIPRNSALIRSVETPRLGATPDGILPGPDGLILSEVKAKHKPGFCIPSPAEWRQVAFQQWVLGPSVLFTRWIRAEIGEDGDLVGLEPEFIDIYPSEVAHILDGVLAIAFPLAARLQSALDFAKELAL